MFKQFYGYKNAYDPMEYTLKGADIEPACLTLSDTAAALCGHFALSCRRTDCGEQFEVTKQIEYFKMPLNPKITIFIGDRLRIRNHVAKARR